MDLSKIFAILDTPTIKDGEGGKEDLTVYWLKLFLKVHNNYTYLEATKSQGLILGDLNTGGEVDIKLLIHKLCFTYLQNLKLNKKGEVTLECENGIIYFIGSIEEDFSKILTQHLDYFLSLEMYENCDVINKLLIIIRKFQL